MDKRKIHISVLVGILALALVVGLTAGFLSTSVEAATSSELKAQLDALNAEADRLSAEIQARQEALAQQQAQKLLSLSFLHFKLFLSYISLAAISAAIVT